MADTGTVTETFNPKIGDIQRLDFAWTSDASGNAEKLFNTKLNGFILAVITDPDDTNVPTTYSVVIEDDKSVDILAGIVVTRSTSAIEQIAIPLDSGLPRPVSTGSFTFKVASAGNAKKGLAQVYLK